jgi:prepilin-type N-terminal cleavage/methylation domain-containing protein
VFNRQAGFTLIELLVVIAIIAVLMSILMPALHKVRLQAQDVIDKSNQHQFALIWKFYSDEHDGFFPKRGSGTDCDQVNLSAWPNVIWEYMPSIDQDLWCCPAATKRWDEGGRAPWAAWNTDPSCEPLLVGSYAVNYWVANYEGESESGADRDPVKFWRTPNIKGASFAPFMLDCTWKDIEPEPEDQPPPYNGDMDISGGELKRACMDRHAAKNNMSFLDLSVKAIRLKCLWNLDWHKKWPNEPVLPEWPEWMADMSECY